MRLTLQSAALLLLAYVLGVAALAWWGYTELERAAAAVMDETAELVASEVAAALDEQAVRGLVEGEPANRRALLNQVFELTRRSAMVRSLEVVDASGEIFASDRFEAIGRTLPTPERVFPGRPRPRLLTEEAEGLAPGRYVLAMPLARDGQLLGYLRLGLDSSELAGLYRGMLQRLFVTALAGLVLIAGVAWGLHVQLRRRTDQLVVAIEQAAIGADPGLPVRRDELAPAFAAAGRLSQELQLARGQSARADRRLQRLAHLMDVGVLLLSRDLEVDFASERTRLLLGVPPGGGQEQWQEALAPLEGILQSGSAERSSVLQADLEIQRLGRTRRIRCQIHPLDEEGNAGYLVQARDRDLLEAIETDLRLAAQLRALTRVYRGVAHDLRAPLNAMVLNLELLRRSVDPQNPPSPELPDKQQRWIRVIEQELQRLRRALDVLLAQTAPPSEQAERFDLRGVVEEIATLLHPQARQQRIEVQTGLPEHEVPVTAFRDQIKQAALNIAINGLEAIPGEGALTLTIETDTTEARMRIADSGPGIPPDLRDRIFDMHFTTKQSGTGIGLYVARSIVEAQGGTLSLERTGPSGTTFLLTMPLEELGS